MAVGYAAVSTVVQGPMLVSNVSLLHDSPKGQQHRSTLRKHSSELEVVLMLTYHTFLCIPHLGCKIRSRLVEMPTYLYPGAAGSIG